MMCLRKNDSFIQIEVGYVDREDEAYNRLLETRSEFKAEGYDGINLKHFMAFARLKLEVIYEYNRLNSDFIEAYEEEEGIELIRFIEIPRHVADSDTDDYIHSIEGMPKDFVRRWDYKLDPDSSL